MSPAILKKVRHSERVVCGRLVVIVYLPWNRYIYIMQGGWRLTFLHGWDTVLCNSLEAIYCPDFLEAASWKNMRSIGGLDISIHNIWGGHVPAQGEYTTSCREKQKEWYMMRYERGWRWYMPKYDMHTAYLTFLCLYTILIYTSYVLYYHLKILTPDMILRILGRHQQKQIIASMCQRGQSLFSTWPSQKLTTALDGHIQDDCCRHFSCAKCHR